MVNKTISITDFLFEKLREEINASLLIEKLCREHYKLIPREVEIQKNKKQELKEQKARKLKEIHDNFFANNNEPTEEKFAQFMASCSEELKLKCGLL